MTTQKARKQAARELAEQDGISYTAAKRRLTPYPDEEDIDPAELGVRALPSTAPPQDRARAEATWRPVHPGRPCRCSGQCRHGQPCTDCVTTDVPLPTYPQVCNYLIHLDRYPGSLFSHTLWEDTYGCEACGEQWSTTVQLTELPWAAPQDGGGLLVFSGVRHPNFADMDAPEHPEGDGSCRSCGGYALWGLLCDGCRAAGWTDSYGMVSEPDEDDDDDPNACPECGAGGRGDPYGECVCYDDVQTA